MSNRRTIGLLQYIALSDAERDFYKITGYLTSETPEKPTHEIDLTTQQKNKGGRPKVKININEKRAYYLWSIAKELPDIQRKHITNRKLIEIAKNMPFRGLFKGMTSQATLEQSISRGKKELKIDAEWNSKVCVLLERDFHKLQR